MVRTFLLKMEGRDAFPCSPSSSLDSKDVPIPAPISDFIYRDFYIPYLWILVAIPLSLGILVHPHHLSIIRFYQIRDSSTPRVKSTSPLQRWILLHWTMENSSVIGDLILYVLFFLLLLMLLIDGYRTTSWCCLSQ